MDNRDRFGWQHGGCSLAISSSVFNLDVLVWTGASRNLGDGGRSKTHLLSCENNCPASFLVNLGT